MRSLVIGLACTAAATLALSSAHAKDPEEAPAAPARYAALQACRDIADAAQRLACFDQRSAELDASFKAADVVIADREQIREAKRGLFGLTFADFKLFSRDKGDEIEEIESTVAGVSYAGMGKLLIRLEDGASWVQTDTRQTNAKVGDKIKIRRAAMGSYLANIGDRIAIRVRRLND